MAGWAYGAGEIARQLPVPRPTLQDSFHRPVVTGNEEFRFPLIEAAAADLETRRIVTPNEWQRIRQQAEIKAFTVANLVTEDAIDKVRKALVEDVREGGTLKAFRDRMQSAIETSGLARHHVENIYRTNVGKAYEDGKKDLVEATGDAFPFVLDHQVLDSRISDLCKTMHGRGIQGTDIFLRDDPEWQRLRPTRHWNCRCAAAYLSVREAARKGIRYAQDWLRRGQRPPNPPYVRRIPAQLPEGWKR